MKHITTGWLNSLFFSMSCLMFKICLRVPQNQLAHAVSGYLYNILILHRWHSATFLRHEIWGRYGNCHSLRKTPSYEVVWIWTSPSLRAMILWSKFHCTIVIKSLLPFLQIVSIFLQWLHLAEKVYYFSALTLPVQFLLREFQVPIHWIRDYSQWADSGLYTIFDNNFSNIPGCYLGLSVFLHFRP